VEALNLSYRSEGKFNINASEFVPKFNPSAEEFVPQFGEEEMTFEPEVDYTVTFSTGTGNIKILIKNCGPVISVPVIFNVFVPYTGSP
jgi:hypothetical protein